MKLLSLDIAEVSGYGLWHDGHLLRAGVIMPAPRMRGYFSCVEWERLPGPRSDFTATGSVMCIAPEPDAWRYLLGQDPFDAPEHLVVERPFIGQNPQTGLSLGERHGRIIAYLGFQAYTRITKYTPNEWRQAAESVGFVQPKKVGKWAKGEKSEALKAEAQRVVRKKWRLTTNHNAAEGVLVGHCYNVSGHAPYALPESYPS